MKLWASVQSPWFAKSLPKLLELIIVKEVSWCSHLLVQLDLLICMNNPLSVLTSLCSELVYLYISLHICLWPLLSDSDVKFVPHSCIIFAVYIYLSFRLPALSIFMKLSASVQSPWVDTFRTNYSERDIQCSCLLVKLHLLNYRNSPFSVLTSLCCELIYLYISWHVFLRENAKDLCVSLHWKDRSLFTILLGGRIQAKKTWYKGPLRLMACFSVALAKRFRF
jgi:hypothetical protein